MTLPIAAASSAADVLRPSAERVDGSLCTAVSRLPASLCAGAGKLAAAFGVKTVCDLGANKYAGLAAALVVLEAPARQARRNPAAARVSQLRRRREGPSAPTVARCWAC
ncbi:hypothetical protein JOF53_000769 [Crossiella equi]|uniref:Uncharacterized protein n=1 Tax=Crossiella equi TaxID=130796 RepID=A0ABS5A6L4_9PSEU|nr:hypothetical protein [Crossiella equi]MBP2471897.1 hypothetical protein [Crossiella equi]